MRGLRPRRMSGGDFRGIKNGCRRPLWRSQRGKIGVGSGRLRRKQSQCSGEWPRPGTVRGEGFRAEDGQRLRRGRAKRRDQARLALSPSHERQRAGRSRRAGGPSGRHHLAACNRHHCTGALVKHCQCFIAFAAQGSRGVMRGKPTAVRVRSCGLRREIAGAARLLSLPC